MPDENAAPAAPELSLTQKLESALAEIDRLKAAAAGPPPPPDPRTLPVEQLMVQFLDGIHVLLGSHPSVHELWQVLRDRILNPAPPAPKA